MSSSPPTEVTVKPRWRDLSGWSLRTRLVATMIALLAMLGLVVGATAGITVRKALFKQTDRELTEAARRPLPPAELLNPPSGSGDGSPGAGSAGRSGQGRYVQAPGALTVVVANGAVTRCLLFDGQPDPELTPPADTVAVLLGVPTDNKGHTYDLGELGSYRLLAQQQGDTTRINGLPLDRTESTLYLVAWVVGGVIVLMLVAAGWAGAALIRRNLRPLSRVAATSGRVAELSWNAASPS
jgi:two-component system OmpR family sensor kinase